MSTPEQTLKEIDAYLKGNPGDAIAWNSKGVLEATLQQFGPALRSLDQAIRLDPNMHQAHTNRGRVLLALGLEKAPEALKSFDAALKLKPNDLDALRDKAIALRALSRISEELKCLDMIVKEAPEELRAWLRIGDIYLEEGKFEHASASFAKVLERDEQNVRALIHQSIALSMLKKWNDAINAAETACKITPDDAEVWRVLGDVNLRAEKNRAAMKALKKASEVDPSDPNVENTMGMLQYKTGNLRDAIRHFRRAIIRDRKNRRAYRNYALVSMELEEWENAAKAWQKYVKLEKNDAIAFDALGTTFARLEDFCGAADAWESSRKLFKKRGEEKEASRVAELGRAARINCGRLKKAYRAQREQEKATRSFSDRHELRRKKKK
ncbi:MAG: tetratricopeptide repeat protein [Candidatus Thorarchaeota archaeon]